MKPAAEPVRDRLGLEVIIESSKIAPGGIAANLDQARAEHDAETEEAKKPDDDAGCLAAGEWAWVEQRTKKDGKETGLEQLKLPTVAVPLPTQVDERHVDGPQDREQNGVGVTSYDYAGKRESDPSGRNQHGIGMVEPENRWHSPEGGPGST